MNDLGKNTRLVIAISKGIVRDQHSRRTVLFFVVLVAIGMVFVGSVLLNRWLLANPWLFLLYWGACLWLTFLSILMALYDLLMLRREARRERQRLKEEVFQANKKNEPGSRP